MNRNHRVLPSISCAALLASSLGAGCANAETAPAEKSPAPKTEKSAKQTNENKKEVPPVLNFTMKSLNGKDVDLAKYQGQVLLLVNTASRCGYTKQYSGLQELHKSYAGKGLAVMGFPSNDFGAQEPASDGEIGEFCQKNYGVEFDMFSKVQVKGEGKTPLYAYLTNAETNPDSPGEVGWNFEKFLIGRDGKIAARFKSNVPPDSEQMTKAIEAELEKK